VIPLSAGEGLGVRPNADKVIANEILKSIE